MTDIPVVEIFEWDITEIADPAGTRHLAGGSFAFKQKVSLGCAVADPLIPSTSGTLIFQDLTFNINAAPSHKESRVAPLTIRVSTSGNGISNMRLYLTQNSVFQASLDQGLDAGFIQIATSGIWQPNGVLPSGAGTRLTTAIPSSFNIKRQDGAFGLVAEDDANVSEYIYTNVVIPFGTSFGEFGACGSGLLTLGLAFDYFQNTHLLF